MSEHQQDGEALRSGSRHWIYGAAVVLFLSVTLLAAYFVNPPRVRWDGVFYYITLRSVYFDGDIDFRDEANEYAWIRMLYGTEVDETGRLKNPFPVGSAVLWTPFFLVGHEVCKADEACDAKGYAAPYMHAIVMATAFWVAVGVLVNIATLHRLFGQLPLSIITVVALLLASPLIFYATEEADYSHGNAYFANALLLWLTVWSFDTRRLHVGRYFLCGLALGLVFLVRWQDVLVGIVPVALILSSGRGKPLGGWLCERTLQLCALGIGALIGALPQLIFWQDLYGSFLTIPQGDGFLTLEHVEPLRFFFSTWNGVFLFHPLLLLAAIGFFVAPRAFHLPAGYRPWIFKGALLLVIIVQCWLSMMVRDWWGGGSFGQRRLVSILPLLSIGLYHVCQVWLARPQQIVRGALASLLVAMILYNGLTLVRYYEEKLPFNPEDTWWYESKVLYEHFDYPRRFGDLLLGRYP